MITCAIIDDEPLAIRLLESYVLKTPFLELRGKYGSALKAMEGLSSAPVDLLFLDIQMPEVSGLEFSKMIDKKTRIIFTTAFDQYAVDSYRVNALDYLLKPISYTDFVESANKAMSWFALAKNESTEGNLEEQKPPTKYDSIFIKTEYRLVQIELSKILYIEGLKDYVKIYVENEAHPILSLMSMKAMEDILPNNRFVRVHRSFIVQPEKIRVIERGRIVFGKEYIPISDNYKESFYSFLCTHSLVPKQ